MAVPWVSKVGQNSLLLPIWMLWQFVLPSKPGVWNLNFFIWINVFLARDSGPQGPMPMTTLSLYLYRCYLFLVHILPILTMLIEHSIGPHPSPCCTTLGMLTQLVWPTGVFTETRFSIFVWYTRANFLSFCYSEKSQIGHSCSLVTTKHQRLGPDHKFEIPHNLLLLLAHC